jgi:hypothetical protein
MGKGMFLGIVFLLSATQASAATKILWQQFYARFTYREFDFSCKGSTTGNFFNHLVLEIDGGKVLRASLRKEALPGQYTSLNLDAKTVASMKVKQDAADRWWIESINIDPKALVWLVGHSDEYRCDPSKRIASLTPYGQTFQFSVKKVETVNALYSPRVMFSGKTTKGETYELDMDLVQHAEKEN